MSEGSRLRSSARRAASGLRAKLHADLLGRVLELHGAFDDLNRMLRRELDQVYARLDVLQAELDRLEGEARSTGEAVQ